MTPPPLPKQKTQPPTIALIVIIAIVAVVLVGGGILAAILVPTVGKVRETARRVVDASNARQIVQASLIFTIEHGNELPTYEAAGGTIHGVAALLAQGGGLNEASAWFASSRSHTAGGIPVLGAGGTGLHPVFKSQSAFAWDYATGVKLSDPPSTPVAWARGLRASGTWGPEGTYGDSGGHIAFLNGSVVFFTDLSTGPLVRPDGSPTRNILEALPPGARVVGSGPGSLHGSIVAGR